MAGPSPVSPLAPDHFAPVPAVPGIRLAAGAAGIRYPGRTDVMVIELAPGTAAAGVFTRSLTAAAPVRWDRQVIARGHARAVIVNSGNANAFTGADGERVVARTVRAAADMLACAAEEVLVASTGVIGEPLPVQRLLAVLPQLFDGLSADGWANAARAIMTTDTYPKAASRQVMIDGVPVTINGIAKGAGMIAPDMATMLAFLATDAALPPVLLQELLNEAVVRSFNAITIDGDTSTNDTALLFASGAAAHQPVGAADDPRLEDFRTGLGQVTADLAQMIVRDGEGATRFVTITVTGAETDQAARRLACTVANSPLVKTAIAGADPNWGRIVAALGRAGERIDADTLTIRIGGTLVAARGGPVPAYDEAPVAAHMQGRAVDIAIDAGIGFGAATVWTCDLTHGYIDINADYRS
ncbi:MAG: bifunctional glutamate N-acetyltransferase/amino-acid acetyltransferase ArgJ [Defluviicoccus sp.]